MPQVTAKPLSLTVRPFHVANLCFEVGGILGESFTELGAQVSAFDFDSLYKSFRDAGTLPGNPGRLEFDSVRIDGATKPPVPPDPPPAHPLALAALRAETVKAALNKAILSRENAFITKYGGIAAIADVMRKIIPFRGQQINQLSFLSDGLMKTLNAAYEKDPERKGVVTTAVTDTTSTLTPRGSTSTETFDPQKLTGKSTTKFIPEATNVKFSAQEIQQTRTKNVEFRAPIFENLARNQRAQIDIGREVVSFVSETHFLNRLEDVFKNELASIDADVNQMQVAYLNTILMSPIDGIVTGVYKNPGDPVAAGEPVFRVENNDDVLIVARISCRGPIVVGPGTTEGSMLQVKTTLFDLPNSPVTIVAKIVAARGQGEDDQWEVIAKCSNLDADSNSIFPLGYSFDYDDTEVSIFGPNEI